MITGIQDVYYNVRDMNRAVEFYKKALGLSVSVESTHFTCLDCNGVRIALHWTEGPSVPAIPKDNHGAHAGATVTFRSNDVAADRKKLEEHDARILSEVKQPWGHMLVFEDLDGNILKLMNPKI